MRFAQVSSLFEVDDMLPQHLKVEFRKKISKILILQLSKSFAEQENRKLKNSIQYKVGSLFLTPLHKAKKISKRLVFYICKWHQKTIKKENQIAK